MLSSLVMKRLQENHQLRDHQEPHSSTLNYKYFLLSVLEIGDRSNVGFHLPLPLPPSKERKQWDVLQDVLQCTSNALRDPNQLRAEERKKRRKGQIIYSLRNKESKCGAFNI